MDTQFDAIPAESEDERCPLTAALAAIGGKWSLIVLYWLEPERRRFAELRRLMPGISHKVLTETLRDLERAGLVDRAVFPEMPPRVEYSISEHGRSALPVVEIMRRWGRHHLGWTDARDGTAPGA
jgi:DNA-binding HxlR family transcriptional regulator